MKKITDKMRLDWLAERISSSCQIGGPVTWYFTDTVPPYDIFEKPRTLAIRKAIDAAIKSHRGGGR